MITLKTSLIKEIASKISKGVTKENLTRTAEMLEIKASKDGLVLAVTNTQFYLAIKLNLESVVEDLHATIDADTFIKLIQKTTTDEIELSLQENYLLFKGNGEYKFPLEIQTNGEMRILPTIEVEEGSTFEINGDTLYYVNLFCGQELTGEVTVDTAQKYYYLDNKGAITFTESPYLYNFSINTDEKLLLTERLAGLFSLFKGQKVLVTVCNEAENNIYQKKIKLESDNIKLTSFIPPDTLVEKYPAQRCRELQENPYPGKISLNRLELLNAIERLSIFNNKALNVLNADMVKASFTVDGVYLESLINTNKEFISYTEKHSVYNYNCYINIRQLQRHVKTGNTATIDVSYGNDLCIMFVKDSFVQIIPEMEQPNG